METKQFLHADYPILTKIVSRVSGSLVDPRSVRVLRLAQVMVGVVRYILPRPAFSLTQMKDVLISMAILTRSIGLSLSVASIVLAMVSTYLFVTYQTRKTLRRFRYMTDLSCSLGWLTIFAILHVYSETNYPWVDNFLLGMLWLGTSISSALRQRKAQKLAKGVRAEQDPAGGQIGASEDQSDTPSSHQAMELPGSAYRAELSSSRFVQVSCL